MIGLYILAAILVFLVLLAQLPVGCLVEYRADGLRVWARVGPVRIQMFPWKWGKHKKNQKEPAVDKQKSQPVPETDKSSRVQATVGERLGGALDYIQALVPLVVEAAGRFYHKLRMDVLELELTIGMSDPADAAMAYGRANAVLATLWEPLVYAFHVQNGVARVKVDFNGRGTRLYGKAALSIRIGQALHLGMIYGFRTLRTYLNVREKRLAAKQQRKAA